MIKILSLDTTSKNASISISIDNEVRYEYNFATQDELSAVLVSSIEFVLNSSGFKLSDIDAFGVGIGPGLFTGMRVGLAALKGLIFGTGKPVVPVVTLEALAYKYNESGLPIIAMIDAKRDEVYIAGYLFVNNHMEEIMAPALIPISRLKEHVESLGSDFTEFYFVGSGAEAYKTLIREHFGQSKICRRSYFLASEICKIAFSQLKKNKYITDLQRLFPFYIRKPDAEENWGDKEAKPALC